jgi:hypothetical protein
LSSNREKSDEHEHRGGRNYVRVEIIPADRSYTNTRDVTAATYRPWTAAPNRMRAVVG